jgi:flagellar motor switch protein FliM
MAEILSQDEIDQLLMAIGPGDGKETLKKRSCKKSKILSEKQNNDLLKILSQKEIDNLLNLITGAKHRNKTIIGEKIYKSAEYKRDDELSQEEIDMLLNPIDNDKK